MAGVGAQISARFSLTAVATEGEIWLWPLEMTCSALHLRGHDVAQAEERGALGEGRDVG